MQRVAAGIQPYHNSSHSSLEDEDVLLLADKELVVVAEADPAWTAEPGLVGWDNVHRGAVSGGEFLDPHVHAIAHEQSSQRGERKPSRARKLPAVSPFGPDGPPEVARSREYRHAVVWFDIPVGTALRDKHFAAIGGNSNRVQGSQFTIAPSLGAPGAQEPACTGEDHDADLVLVAYIHLRAIGAQADAGWKTESLVLRALLPKACNALAIKLKHSNARPSAVLRDVDLCK